MNQFHIVPQRNPLCPSYALSQPHHLWRTFFFVAQVDSTPSGRIVTTDNHTSPVAVVGQGLYKYLCSLHIICLKSVDLEVHASLPQWVLRHGRFGGF